MVGREHYADLCPHGLAWTARAVAIVAGTLTVVAAVMSVVVSARIDSEPARAGDIAVVMEDFQFAPAEIDADGGTVSVHVTNKDSTRHTFTIEAVGVDLNVPPNSTQRVSFEAEPGTYRYFCRPHAPDMEGQLLVR